MSVCRSFSPTTALPPPAHSVLQRQRAMTRAGALSRKSGHAGAVAFSRSREPATGDFIDAKLIRKFDDMPEDLSAPLNPRNSVDCAARSFGCAASSAPRSARLGGCSDPASRSPSPNSCSWMRAKVHDLCRERDTFHKLEIGRPSPVLLDGEENPRSGRCASGRPSRPTANARAWMQHRRNAEKAFDLARRDAPAWHGGACSRTPRN